MWQRMRSYFDSPQGINSLMWFWKFTAFLSVFRFFSAEKITSFLIAGLVGTSALALAFTFQNARQSEENSSQLPSVGMERGLKLVGYLAIALQLSLFLFRN